MGNIYRYNGVRRILLAIAFAFAALSIQSQTIIRGSVRDANTNEPLIGVTIRNAAAKNGGVLTDISGNFTLNLGKAELPVTLETYYVGYRPQTIDVYDVEENVEIAITEHSNFINEVVVTAIGKERRADQLGSTASVISADKIQKSGNATLINGLAGKASGVKISSPNGDVGSGSNIIVRGVNTFIGNSQPLIILDGQPISNDYNTGNTSNNYTQESRLNDINQDDIESLQILKGASAAALWGSRAANGVIVITTKSGKKASKPNISYSYTKSIDWISFRHPIQTTYGQGTGGKWSSSTNLSWGDKISERSGEADVYDTSGGYFVGQSGKVYYPILQKNSREVYTESNWDAVYGNGGFDQHNLSISGGNDRGSYFLSYGGLFQDGVLKNTYYNKHNVRLNTAYRFADWIKASAKVAYIKTSANRGHTNGDTTNGALLGVLRTPADFDNSDYIGTYVDANNVEHPNRQRMYRNTIGANAQPTYTNPLWSINKQKAETEVNRFIITPEFNIDPTDWLDITLRGGVDYYTEGRDILYPVGSASSNFSKGYYDHETTTHRELNFDAIVRATHEFSKNFSLTGTLGWSINDRKTIYNSDVLKSFDVDVDLFSSNLASSAANTTWSKSTTHIASNRGYAIVDVELWKQLFVTLTGMQEAASTVSKSYFYPSADVAWQFGQYIDKKILSFGKLRASWGKVGTEPSAYKTITYATSTNSAFGGSYAVSGYRGNEDLKPEVKTEWEIGADLRFLNDNLELKFTYYQNTIRDLLFDVELNPSSGFSNYYSNAGKMKNHGIELELSYNIIDTDDFGLQANLSFNQNRNKVVSLGGTGLLAIGGSSYAIEGYPVGVLYRPGAAKDENGNWILDSNGFPTLSSSNIVLGDPNPDWRGGFGMDLRYKDFDFSFLFEHSHGGVLINRTQEALYGFGLHEDVSHEVTLTEDLVNYAGQTFKAGTTVRGNICDFGGGKVLLDESWYNSLGGGLGYDKINDLFVRDNTWTKLRTITLGYTLRSAWLKNASKLNSIRFSVTGRDLLCWSNQVGIDPESNNYGVSNAQGMDYFSSPATRSVLFNIQVNY